MRTLLKKKRLACRVTQKVAQGTKGAPGDHFVSLPFVCLYPECTSFTKSNNLREGWMALGVLKPSRITVHQNYV
jgi:hypothetical protein